MGAMFFILSCLFFKNQFAEKLSAMKFRLGGIDGVPAGVMLFDCEVAAFIEVSVHGVGDGFKMLEEKGKGHLIV